MIKSLVVGSLDFLIFARLASGRDIFIPPPLSNKIKPSQSLLIAGAFSFFHI